MSQLQIDDEGGPDAGGGAGLGFSLQQLLKVITLVFIDLEVKVIFTTNNQIN